MELFKLLGRIAIDGAETAKNQIDNVSDTAEKSESKITSAFKKIGTAVVTYFAADKIKSFGADCVSMASNVEEMENKFNVVFQGMTDEVDSWATQYAGAIGRNKNAIKGYLADNQNMFVGMGMTRESAAGLSENLVSLALDLASFNNLNETDAVNAMSKAIMGETESAKSLGAVLNDNTRAIAMEQLGYEGKYNELTEAQKMEVNYQAILNQSADAVGDCARSLDSYKGRQLQAASAVENLKEKIGKYLLPVMTKFQETTANVATWLSEHLDPAMQNIKEKFEAFKEKATEVGDYVLDALYPVFQDLETAFETVKEALQPFIDALVEYVTSGEFAEDVTNNIKGAIDILTAAYNVIKGAIILVVDALKNVVEWGKKHETGIGLIAIALGTFTTALIAYNVQQAISNAGGITAIATNAAHAVALGATTVATTIATAATTAFGTAVAFLTSPITLVIAAIGALIAIVYLLVKNWNRVKEVAVKCWEGIKGAFSKAASWFKSSVVDPIAKFFGGLWNSIVNIFKGAGSWFKSFVVDPITNFFGGMWDKLKSGASGVWDGIKSVFNNVADFFKTTFSNAWEGVVKVFKAGGEIFTNIKDGVVNVFKTVVNGLIKGINTVVAVPFNAINKVLEGIKNVKIAGIKPFSGIIKTIDVPEIPQLKKGGVLDEGEIGLLEGDGAEAVVPLDQNRKWISKVAKDMNSTINEQGGNVSNKTLEDILELMKVIYNNLPDVLADSLSRGVKFDVDKREFGRLVRQVNNG